MNTPADKPDLPAYPAGNFAPKVPVIAMAVVQALLADERRKALEFAEALLRQRLDAAKHTHAISEGLYSEGMRDAYDVAVLDIQSMIERKESTK